MNKYYSLIVLCALAWLVNAPASSAQSANQTTLPTDPAITPLSVTGVVTEFTRTKQALTWTSRFSALPRSE